jgi:CheY-like chemotaxis protein
MISDGPGGDVPTHLVLAVTKVAPVCSCRARPLKRRLRAMSVRVLIVEDHLVTQRVLSHYLERIGCTVVGTVDNAADAVTNFRELYPDLVTVDIHPPEVLGVDTKALFSVIRAEDPNCEVIFLLKPINFDQLASDLRKYYPELKSEHAASTP